jgi:hypothetical protein
LDIKRRKLKIKRKEGNRIGRIKRCEKRIGILKISK